MGKEFISDNGHIIQTPASAAEGFKPEGDDCPPKADSHGTQVASKAAGNKYGVAKKVRKIRLRSSQDAHDARTFSSLLMATQCLATHFRRSSYELTRADLPVENGLYFVTARCRQCANADRCLGHCDTGEDRNQI